MNTNHTAPGWRFLLKRAVATYLGIVASTSVGMLAPFMIILNMDSRSPVLIVVAAILVILSAASLWIVVGVAQWSILRRFMNQRAVVWVGATASGFLGSSLVVLIVQQLSRTSSPANIHGGLYLVLLIAQGSLLGIAQWLVLRKKVSRAPLWIGISLISWTLAGSVTGLIGEWINSGSGVVALILFSNRSVFFGTVLSALGLWWFLDQSIVPAATQVQEENLANV